MIGRGRPGGWARVAERSPRREGGLIARGRARGADSRIQSGSGRGRQLAQVLQVEKALIKRDSSSKDATPHTIKSRRNDVAKNQRRASSSTGRGGSRRGRGQGLPRRRRHPGLDLGRAFLLLVVVLFVLFAGIFALVCIVIIEGKFLRRAQGIMERASDRRTKEFGLGIRTQTKCPGETAERAKMLRHLGGERVRPGDGRRENT